MTPNPQIPFPRGQARRVLPALTLSFALGFFVNTASAAATLPTVNGTAAADTIDQSYTLPNGQPRTTFDEAEKINGMAGNDTIQGGGGNDDIEGSGGDDVVHGGGGDDLVKGADGNDELYGDAGNDTLTDGDGYDYLDDGDGTNTLDGGSRSDLLVGRSNRNTMIGNSGDDFFVIIGNAIGNHTILGDGSAPDAGPTDSNLLFFAKDVNPDNMKVETYQRPQGPFTYAYLEFGLRTDQPVTLNVAEAMAKPFGTPGHMRHVQAFATGNGNDNIIGSAQVGSSQSGGGTYYQRILYLPPFVAMTLDELFFTHEGNDTIDNGGGRDYIDAGPGNDLIVGRAGGQNHLTTGPGNDIIRWAAADLNAASKHMVYDFTPGDSIEITGNVAPAAVTLVEASGTTTVKVSNNEAFILKGVPKANVQVQALSGGGVKIALTGTPPPPPTPPKVPVDRQPGPADGAAAPTGGTRPPSSGGPKQGGGTPAPK